MNPAEEKKLREAAQLLKTGDRAQAQRLFSQALTENPTLAEAWVGLSFCTEVLAERKKCLKRALAIRPEYTYAQNALIRLENETPPTPSPSPTPQAAPQPAPISPPKAQGWSEKQVTWALVGIVMSVVCLLTGLVVVLTNLPLVTRPSVVARAGRPRFIEFYANW